MPSIPIEIVRPDANVFPDLVSNQITAVATPSVGDQVAYVMADGGVDEGVFVRFTVPDNYVGTPKIRITALLDGAPSAGDDLGFGFREHIAADNAAGDVALATEQTTQNTDIGSSGSNYSSEDIYVAEITLTGTYVAGAEVFGYLFLDASGTTYTGNVLLLTARFTHL